jgi:hypothetical protein
LNLEHDIDLLSEEELYDINTISSMFKGWLRELPDEIFPKPTQVKIAESVTNMQEQVGAPEMLKTELSKLPPFNYYLLFAVTAHITMLLNSSKENKMTFHNLCVCFMPALKVDMACFSWLILDWKNCWQGCATEKDYLTREYALQKKSDEEGDDASLNSIPVQHFDRYPPPHAQSHESGPTAASRDQASSVSSSLPSERGGLDHYRPTNPTGRNQTGSPVKARVVEPPVTVPSLQPSNSRRGKKPVPLESTLLGSVRQENETSTKPANNKPTEDKSQPQQVENRNGLSKNGSATTEQQKSSNSNLLPELAPVQPLSPFGALDSFSR